MTSADAAFVALDRTDPYLVGVRAAGDVIAWLGRGRRYLHAGPPIGLDELPGPMRGAVIGALLYEHEASTPEEAEEILEAGELEIAPCHDHGAVGAMAGVISAHLPVVVAGADGRLAVSPLNEGLGAALRYGSFDADTLSRLRFLAEVIAPLLDAAISRSEPIRLFELIAEGLRRGDDCHNRLVATSAALLLRLAPGLVSSASDKETVAEALERCASNGHFALPFAIAAGKFIADAASGCPGSPIVTAMAGNGRRFGIRVSGTGQRWFLAPSPIGEAKLVEGATLADVTPTMGDSMIAETVGFGAFAMTAAPAIMSFVGGDMALARGIVEEMRLLCRGTSSRLLIPAEDHRGTPLGIDVHVVAERGVAPMINNGLAHRDAGRGRAGAGLTRIPLELFIAASESLRSAPRFAEHNSSGLPPAEGGGAHDP